MFNSYTINKDLLINNVKQVATNNPKSKICAMVKANAYGVGVNRVVPILNDYVDYFGVACFFEAKKLSKITNRKILIVGPLDRSNINTKFSYTCSSVEEIRFLKQLNKKINIHLKINTGMNRYGFKNVKDFIIALKLIKTSKLNLEGVFTHFLSSDRYVKKQVKRFKLFKNIVNGFGFKTIFHADNSSVNLKYNHGFDMVRVGYSLFNNNKNGFRVPVNIKSKIVQINNVLSNEYVGYNKRFKAHKNVRVAIVPVGYADGFSARLIGMSLRVNHKTCKILNVCMDCFMVDLTGIKNVFVGSEVVILGECGDKQITLEDYAKAVNFSPYEVLTNFRTNRMEVVVK